MRPLSDSRRALRALRAWEGGRKAVQGERGMCKMLSSNQFLKTIKKKSHQNAETFSCYRKTVKPETKRRRNRMNRK